MFMTKILPIYRWYQCVCLELETVFVVSVLVTCRVGALSAHAASTD